jgi:hypothetical protein
VGHALHLPCERTPSRTPEGVKGELDLSKIIHFILGSQAWEPWINDFLIKSDVITSECNSSPQLEEQLAAVRRTKPDAVIFLGHHETLERDLIWAHELRGLAPRIVLPNSTITELAYDKRKMGILAASAKEFSAIQELTRDEAVYRLTGESSSVILKRVKGTEGVGFRVIPDVNTLEQLFSESQASSSDWMLQPFIQGREVSVNIFRTNGKFGVFEPVEKGLNGLASVHPSKRTRYCPSPMLTEAQKKALYRASEELATLVNLDGVAELEFIVAGDAAYFLEINPRIAATMRMNCLACRRSLFQELGESLFEVGSSSRVFPAEAYSQEFPLPTSAEKFRNSGSPWPGVWITSRVTVAADSPEALMARVEEVKRRLGQ